MQEIKKAVAATRINAAAGWTSFTGNALLALWAKLLRWTKEVPTKPGGYWVRNSKTRPQRMVYLKFSIYGAHVSEIGGGGDLVGQGEFSGPCEWAGPILEPLEVEEDAKPCTCGERPAMMRCQDCVPDAEEMKRMDSPLKEIEKMALRAVHGHVPDSIARDNAEQVKAARDRLDAANGEAPREDAPSVTVAVQRDPWERTFEDDKLEGE